MVKDSAVVAVVITSGVRPDLRGRYDRQALESQRYFYKKPSRDEASGKYLLQTPANGGWKLGTKLSASNGGLARCTASSLPDAAEGEWLVRTPEGAMRVDRSLRLQLLEAKEAFAMTQQVRATEQKEPDLTTRAVQEVFQALAPEADGRVLLSKAISSDLLQGERHLMELLQAAGTSFDCEAFECAYLQCKDRYEIRVAHLVRAFEKFCGKDASRGLAIQDASRFAQQVLPNARDIDWEGIGADKGGWIDLDEFMESAAMPADWLVYRFSKIVGLSALKDEIRRFHRSVLIDERRRVARPKFNMQQRLHMIFRGNPGTGKTRVAELMGRLLCKAGVIKRDAVLEVQRDSLVAQHIGETAIKTQAVINKAKERYGILFIDEAYRLHNPDGAKDFGHEAIEQLMASMLDPDGPTMILAGYRKEMDGFLTANPGLRSRISYTFDFDNYDFRELARILRITAEIHCFSIEPNDEVVASLLQRHTPPGAAEQMNGRMCEIIFDFAKQTLDEQLDPEGDVSFKLSAAHLEAACKRVPRPPQTFIREALDEDDEIEDDEEWLLAQLERIVGMRAVKEELLNFFYTARVDGLRRRLQLATAEELSAHMLFSGPPGVGKTTVARLVALLLHRMGLLPTRKCVEVQREQLVSSPDAVARAIEQACGGVLFVDEAYRLSGGSREDRRGKEAVEQLMASMLSPPPAPLMVFAGYEREMNEFLAMNPGIESRISYRFNLSAYEPEEIARIFLLYIARQGFAVKVGLAPAAPQDEEAVAMLRKLITEHTTQDTRAVYNGRLCQHVYAGAKRRLDRRISAAIRDNGLSAADAREIERQGLVSNTLLLDDVADGLQLLEQKACASRPTIGAPTLAASDAGYPSSGECSALTLPPRGAPFQTIVVADGNRSATAQTYKVGDAVQVLSTSRDGWVDARVLKVSSGGDVTVEYQDGHRAVKTIPFVKRMRLLRRSLLPKGDKDDS